MSAEYKTKCWDILAEPAGVQGCVLSWCCPCITYGINATKLSDAPESVYFGGKFTPSCCAFCLASMVGCHCLLQMPMRQYIRQKYGIQAAENSQLEDFLCTWCCGRCILIQEYNEITAREGVPEGGIMTDMKTAMEAAKADAAEYKRGLDAKTAKALEKEVKDVAKDVTKEVKAEAKELVKAEEAAPEAVAVEEKKD